MGRRDASSKRIKWTRAEKKMVREMKSVIFQPSIPVLDSRSRFERLGKYPAKEPMKDTSFRPHLVTKLPPRLLTHRNSDLW